MSARAKVFMSGRSQAVRLPKEFRLSCKEVQITRVKEGLLLKPVRDLKDVFAELDQMNELYGPFEFERDQPPMPKDKELFK